MAPLGFSNNTACIPTSNEFLLLFYLGLKGFLLDLEMSGLVLSSPCQKLSFICIILITQLYISV